MGEGIEARVLLVQPVSELTIVSTPDRNLGWKILLNLMTYDGLCGNLGRSVGKIGGKSGKIGRESGKKERKFT